MTVKTLQALAKDHASGVLDRGSYRKVRDQFFADVLSGKIKVKPIDFRPPVEVEDLDSTMERERTRIQSVSAQKQSQQPSPKPEIPQEIKPPVKTAPGFPKMLILVVTILVTISVIIILTLLRKSGETVALNTDNRQIEVLNSIPEVESNEPSAGEQLIADFLAQNNWSDENLQEFTSEWDFLTTEEQASGLESPLKAQLANAIYQQLLEERALLNLGESASVLSRQNTLINFASEVGINDSRLRVLGNQ
jgi:hypothetical protein